MKKKFKKITSISFLLLGITFISACSDKNANNNQVISYKEKEVNVCYMDTNNNHKTNIRFYDDTNDIPYIGIKQYYNILVKNTPLTKMGDLKITKNNDLYKVETPRGGIAYVDTLKDTFTSDNYVLFNSTNYYDMSNEGLFQLDGLPWIKVKKLSYNKEASLFDVDFTKYKIKLFGDDKDVYFPFNTVADLFLNDNLLNCSYNQKDIYVINKSENEDIKKFDNYKEPIFKNKFSKEYSEYNYMEICFAYDKLLGRPKRSSIEKNFNLEKGLDYALSNNELGKEIKNLFLSTEISDYLCATQFFNLLFSDGGHSNYIQLDSYGALLNEAERNEFTSGNIYRNMVEKMTSIANKNYPEIADYERPSRDHLLIRSAREKMLDLSFDESNLEKKLCGNDSYYRKDKTAIISIDNFTGDNENKTYWDDYYSGKNNEIPFGDGIGGAVGSIYNGIKKAKEDNVENIIIDLASNTGGSLDELAYLCAFLTNNKSFSYYNHLSGQIMTAEFDIDINLDRKIDEKDDINYVEDFNIAVLSSKNGFSCGGISPIYLHESGIFTMGEESGGGSCSIYYMYDCYGLPHVASSPHQIYTLNGASIDSIRNFSCDLLLNTPVINGVRNYEEFYDIDKLTNYIEEHYGN